MDKKGKMLPDFKPTLDKLGSAAVKVGTAADRLHGDMIAASYKKGFLDGAMAAAVVLIITYLLLGRGK